MEYREVNGDPESVSASSQPTPLSNLFGGHVPLNNFSISVGFSDAMRCR